MGEFLLGYLINDDNPNVSLSPSVCHSRNPTPKAGIYRDKEDKDRDEDGIVVGVGVGVGVGEREQARMKRSALRLLSSSQFHEQGLWSLVQKLTGRMSQVTDKVLRQRLWSFVLSLLHIADFKSVLFLLSLLSLPHFLSLSTLSLLKARFQCISSVALQCPIPTVVSLMFSELKNQIWMNWPSTSPKAETETEKDDLSLDQVSLPSNPFCSLHVVSLFVEQLTQVRSDLESVESVEAKIGRFMERHLDSLNSCLNVVRFVSIKDRETNFTHLRDSDCPLRPAVLALKSELQSLLTLTATQSRDRNRTFESGSGDSEPVFAQRAQRAQRQRGAERGSDKTEKSETGEESGICGISGVSKERKTLSSHSVKGERESENAHALFEFQRQIAQTQIQLTVDLLSRILDFLSSQT